MSATRRLLAIAAITGTCLAALGAGASSALAASTWWNGWATSGIHVHPNSGYTAWQKLYPNAGDWNQGGWYCDGLAPYTAQSGIWGGGTMTTVNFNSSRQIRPWFTNHNSGTSWVQADLDTGISRPAC